jgi:hypothetical protein
MTGVGVQPHPDDDDLGILDLAGIDASGDEAGHFAAADAVFVAAEAAQDAAFLARVPDPAARRALARDRPALSWLRRTVEGNVFCTNPAEAKNYGRAVAQAALETGGGIARRIRAAKAGKVSGGSRMVRNAPRNQWLREQWSRIDATGNAGLLILRTRMRKRGFRPLTMRQLRRIVRPKPEVTK